ncbi:hypothetical protein D9M72_558830 [compost metagenome]
MRRDLEDRVRRGVADRLAAAHVLLAVAGDDVGAGSMAIAEDAGNVAFAADGFDELGRKGIAFSRKVTPIEHDRRAADFPVPGGRVLAARDFAGGAKGTIDPIGHRHALGNRAVGELCCVNKAKGGHVRQIERPFSQTNPICGAGGAELGDVSERVGAQVTVGFGIRRAA